MTRPYERLWSLLESSERDPDRFEALVAKLDADELVKCYADVIDASGDVRPKWEGPLVPDLGGCLSEDATEDLTDWIVGQGYDVWAKACGADDEALVVLFEEASRERVGDDEGRWGGRRTPPIGPAFYASYVRRFDEDDFWDALEAELDSRVVEGDEGDD